MANIWEALAKEKKAYWAHKDETNKFWKLVMEGHPFVVFDVETTGLKKGVDRIIEFSAIRMEKVGYYYRRTASYEWFIKPPFKMDPRVIEVHGITDEFLQDKPEEAEVWEQIKEVFTGNPITMGYNVSFDIKFVNEMFSRYGESFEPEYIDAFTLVKENIFSNEHENKRKLSQISQLLFPDKTFEFHDSSEDILATWDVAVEILKHYVSTNPVVESSKPNANLISYEVKKYGAWKGIFVTAELKGDYHDFYYDVKQSCWVQKYNMIPVFKLINMEDMEEQLNKIAAQKGIKHFHLLKDKMVFKKAS